MASHLSKQWKIYALLRWPTTALRRRTLFNMLWVRIYLLELNKSRRDYHTRRTAHCVHTHTHTHPAIIAIINARLVRGRDNESLFFHRHTALAAPTAKQHRNNVSLPESRIIHRMSECDLLYFSIRSSGCLLVSVRCVCVASRSSTSSSALTRSICEIPSVPCHGWIG